MSFTIISSGLKSQYAYNFSLGDNKVISKKDRKDIPNSINDDGIVNRENASYVGLYFGQRNFMNVPRDVFYLTPDTSNVSYTNVDLGKGRPFIIGLQMMFQNADRGFAFPVQIEGFLGNSSGFTLNLGGGYKIGNPRFSFTPNLTAGLCSTPRNSDQWLS
ncbi:MAG: hypothetical protein WED33_00140 [Bacteroidia bacterium]